MVTARMTRAPDLDQAGSAAAALMKDSVEVAIGPVAEKLRR